MNRNIIRNRLAYNLWVMVKRQAGQNLTICGEGKCCDAMQNNSRLPATMAIRHCSHAFMTIGLRRTERYDHLVVEH